MSSRLGVSGGGDSSRGGVAAVDDDDLLAADRRIETDIAAFRSLSLSKPEQSQSQSRLQAVI